jgi:hypothetical protein
MHDLLAMHGAVVKVESAQEASLSCVDRLKGPNPRTGRRGWRRTLPAWLFYVQKPSLPGLAETSAAVTVTLLLASNCQLGQAGKALTRR